MASFKYTELANYLREQITSGKFQPDAQLPTEQELAKRFDLSRDTVRKAIAALEQEKLIYKIKGSGTYVRPAPAPAMQNRTTSRRIGIMMNDIDSYIFPAIVKGINQVLDEAGYTAVIQITANQISKERAILESFLQDDYAGLIIEPTKAALPQVNYDLYQKLSVSKPTILIHGKIPTLPLSSVTIGDEQGAMELTQYLLRNGQREISIFCKYDEQTGTARYLGFAKAFQQEGLPIPDANIFWTPSEYMETLFSDPLPPAVKKNLKRSTAVICHDDRMALALKKYLLAHPQYSGDMLICGFDDSQIAKDNGFISVAHPKAEFGIQVAKKLLEKINDPYLDVSYDFVPEICINKKQ